MQRNVSLCHHGLNVYLSFNTTIYQITSFVTKSSKPFLQYLSIRLSFEDFYDILQDEKTYIIIYYHENMNDILYD